MEIIDLLQIKMAYEEFGKLLKRLMEGEAIVYVTEFINSSMVKYDKVSTRTNGSKFLFEMKCHRTTLCFCRSVNTRRSHFIHKIRRKHVRRIFQHGRSVLEQRTENHRADSSADFPSYRDRFRDGFQTSHP